MRARLLSFVMVALVVVGASGCGYSLAGRGSFLPSYIQTIGVPNLTNTTTVFDVEQTLTQRVRAEFIGRGKYKVVPETTGVDALLTGDISSITVTPAAFDNNQQATRYIVQVVVKIEFRDLQQNRVLWQNPALVFREEYDLPSTSSAVSVDATAYLGSGSTALERISTDFAKSVVSSILEAF